MVCLISAGGIVFCHRCLTEVGTAALLSIQMNTGALPFDFGYYA